MTIDANDPRITAYVFGELRGEELATFEGQLEQSAELRTLVEHTRKTINLVESDLAATPPRRLSQAQRAVVSAQFDQATHSASAPIKTTPQRDDNRPVPLSVSPPPFPTWGIAVVAALLLLVVGGGVMLLGVRLQPTSSRVVSQSPMAADAAPEMNSTEERYDARGGIGANSMDGSVAPMEMAMEPAAPGMAGGFGGAGGEGMGDMAGMDMGGMDMGGMGAPAGKADAMGMAPAAASSKSIATAGMRSAAPTPSGRPNSARSGPGGVAPFRSAPSAPGGPSPTLPPSSIARRGDGLMGDAESDDDSHPAAFGAVPSGDKFDEIVENAFQNVRDQGLSTFSIDVDTASYSKLRQYLMNGRIPHPNAVRLEELINYFHYDYESPSEDAEVPFAAHLAVSECPWNDKHQLVRIAVKGKEFVTEERPSANLVFLVDVSGSMQQPNKLPLLKRGLNMLTQQLRADDRVSIVVYAGAAGLVLEPTPGNDKDTIMGALDRLRAGGSTNGAQGIKLAYLTAMDHFMEKGVNRVILCSDGDFNVGVTGAPLVKLVEQNAKSKVFLTVLGFGMGNHNDRMMEQISNRGNGNYAFIDNDTEAAKVLVDQLAGTLVTIAKDVKVQVDFNPKHVSAYRMLGYENRRMANKDFDNDAKDAGEIGAGHAVTMLYEVVPTDPKAKFDANNLARPPLEVADGEPQSKYLDLKVADSDEMLTLFMRYKQPDEDQSSRLTFPLKASSRQKFGEADGDFRFAASVASFGMLLRNSQHRGDTNYDAVLEIAAEAAGTDPLRLELLQLVRQAKALSGN